MSTTLQKMSVLCYKKLFTQRPLVVMSSQFQFRTFDHVHVRISFHAAECPSTRWLQYLWNPNTRFAESPSTGRSPPLWAKSRATLANSWTCSYPLSDHVCFWCGSDLHRRVCKGCISRSAAFSVRKVTLQRIFTHRFLSRCNRFLLSQTIGWQKVLVFHYESNAIAIIRCLEVLHVCHCHLLSIAFPKGLAACRPYGSLVPRHVVTPSFSSLAELLQLPWLQKSTKVNAVDFRLWGRFCVPRGQQSKRLQRDKRN